jgi:hypothetical protein
MTTGQRPHISEVVREIWGDLPYESRAKLPVDGASQVDHYLYGLPKKISEGCLCGYVLPGCSDEPGRSLSRNGDRPHRGDRARENR